MATLDEEYRVYRISSGKSLRKQTAAAITVNSNRTNPEDREPIFRAHHPGKLSFRKRFGS